MPLNLYIRPRMELAISAAREKGRTTSKDPTICRNPPSPPLDKGGFGVT